MSTSYRQLKVPELKDLLAKKGLPVSGKKEDLVARLLAAEDKKPVETINQTSKNSVNTNPARKSSIENIINKDPVEQSNDLFDKELNLMTTTDITTGIDNDFDWENLATDINLQNLQKDGEFDTLISPISPSLSVTSIKELSPEKAKTEITEAAKGSNDVINIEVKQSVETTKNPSFNETETHKIESSSNSDSIVKPSGFKCKKIVFDNPTTTPQAPSKPQNDLTTELERRKKRAERFGVELSDADKRLQRAARFGTTVSSPLDAPLTAPRMPNRKPSIVEDDEKLKKRAERFGLDKSNNEDDKKRKRAERFGLNTPSNSASIDNTSTSTNSVSEINEEEKKKRRAERFSINDTNGEPANKKVKT